MEFQDFCATGVFRMTCQENETYFFGVNLSSFDHSDLEICHSSRKYLGVVQVSKRTFRVGILAVFVFFGRVSDIRIFMSSNEGKPSEYKQLFNRSHRTGLPYIHIFLPFNQEQKSNFPPLNLKEDGTPVLKQHLSWFFSLPQKRSFQAVDSKTQKRKKKLRLGTNCVRHLVRFLFPFFSSLTDRNPTGQISVERPSQGVPR